MCEVYVKVAKPCTLQMCVCVCVYRIVDNMPVTWCYNVEGGQKFCNPGFPIGCYVTETGLAKEACVVNVSSCHGNKSEGLHTTTKRFFLGPSGLTGGCCSHPSRGPSRSFSLLTLDLELVENCFHHCKLAVFSSV